MKRFISSLMLISVLFFSCNKTNDFVDKNSDLLTKSAKEVTEANNAFAFEFFNEIANAEAEDNFMVSPLSLSLALGMTYNGANGDTKTAFDNTLNYSSSLTEVNQFSKDLIDKLSGSSDGSVMEIANSIWIEETFPVKEDFVNLNRKYYNAEVENLNFSDPATVDIINEWVSEKTYDKIPTIIEKIEPEEVMFLINALYFNANWKYEFDPEYTENKSFYKSPDETTEAEMMTLTADIEYTENELFTSVILPYKQDKFSMVILLPNSQKTTDNIVSELNSQNWENWRNEYDTTEVSVNIPKFKLKYKNKLNDELIEMGLGIAFSGRADFSNISNIPLNISYVLQKTFIDVNEEGTEAAAVTVVGMEYTSIEPQPITFNANKPFIYMIKENVTGSICFMGRLGDPKYEE
ncbi:MAG: serpin family protein [Bacteroidota bacterium]